MLDWALKIEKGVGKFLLKKENGGGNGKPLQNPCLKNSMDRRAWWVAVLEVAELDATEHER